MGQQQLLLLVAAIVVVGLATIYGIYTFTEANDRANVDLLVHDGMDIITDIQTWKSTPGHYGGGREAQDFSTVTFSGIGRRVNNHFDLGSFGQVYFHEREMGCYVLATEGSLAPPGGFALAVVNDYEACAVNQQVIDNIVAAAFVTGTNADDITWDFSYHPTD